AAQLIAPRPKRLGSVLCVRGRRAEERAGGGRGAHESHDAHRVLPPAVPLTSTGEPECSASAPAGSRTSALLHMNRETATAREVASGRWNRTRAARLQRPARTSSQS